MSAARARGSLVAVLIVAAVCRVAFSGWVVGFRAMTEGDEVDYHAIATNLASGEGFASFAGTPTARRPPAFPFFLAAIYRATGADPVAGRAAQILLGVAVVLLVFFVARRLFDEPTALVAAALAAVNPFLVFISGYLLTENLYIVCLLGALALAPTPRALVVGSATRALAAAALLGLATLTRPTGLPVAEWILVAAILLAGASLRARLERAASAAAVIAFVVLPWCARNAVVMGGWTGLTTHGGITFLQGNNDKVAEEPSWRGGAVPMAVLPRAEELGRMGELDRDRLAWRMGREYLRENWRHSPRVAWWKFVRFWRLRSEMGLSGVRSGWWWSTRSGLGRLAARLDAGFAYAAVVIPLFVAGLVLTRRRWRELAFLYGIVAVHTMTALVFFGSLRGRIPVEPVIATFAAAALVTLARGVRGFAAAPGAAHPPRLARPRGGSCR